MIKNCLENLYREIFCITDEYLTIECKKTYNFNIKNLDILYFQVISHDVYFKYMVK